MRGSKFLHILTVLFIISFSGIPAYSQTPGQNYALLIGGLGGEERYSQEFFSYLKETYDVFTNKFKLAPENIRVLTEQAYANEPFIYGVSTAENIKDSFRYFAGKITNNDDIYIILFGHGNFDGKNSKLNIPRRDLSEVEYAELIESLNGRRVIFVNTASSSFPFIKYLSSINRIVITATSSPTQRNLTVFPEFFVKGLSDADADLDKNDKLSVLELFKYASQRTERYFSEEDHLATEYAILEDTGDREGFRVNELEQNGEGLLAEVTYINRQVLASSLPELMQKDSTVVNLIKEQEELELRIAKLKKDKSNFKETEYYTKLEELLVKLAQITERLEKKKDKN